MVQFDPTRRNFLKASAAVAGLAATDPAKLLAQDDQAVPAVQPHGSLQGVQSFIVFDGTPVDNANLTPAAMAQLSKVDMAIVSGDQWTPDMLKNVGKTTHAKRVNTTAETDVAAEVEKAKSQGFNGVFIVAPDDVLAGDKLVEDLRKVKETSPDIAVVVNRGFGPKQKELGALADAVIISDGFTQPSGEKWAEGDRNYIAAQVKNTTETGTKVLALDIVKDPETAKEAAQYWAGQGIPSYGAEPGFQKVAPQPSIRADRAAGM